MPTEVLMPALSPTMTEGRIAKWLVGPGDKVTTGDIIAEIETDKATMEIEAVEDGNVATILVPEGTDSVKVNTPIAVIVEDGEDISTVAADSRDAVQTGGASAARQPHAEQGYIEPGKTENKAVRAADMSNPSMVMMGDGQNDTDANMVTMTVREALRDAMAEEMRRDDDVFIMGEEVAEYQGAYKVTQGLLEEFGDRRVIDTPITEHGFSGVGIGAALAGLKPIVEFMTFNFSMQAMDQIVNSAAKTLYMSGGQLGCSIVFRGPNGPAAQVGAQHSQDYSSWYSHIPGLKVVQPYTAADAKGLLKSAIRDPNPVIFLENEILYGQSFPVPQHDDWIVPIGKARIARPGRDATVVSWGSGLNLALQAAEILQPEGIDVEVIDLRTLRPMDSETIMRSVVKTGRVVCVEQGWPQCSVSSEICTQVMEQAFDYLDAPPTRITAKDVPLPYAANLEKLALPKVEDVISAIKAVSYR